MYHNRRAFINLMGSLVPGVFLKAPVNGLLSGQDPLLSVEGITVYLVNVDKPRNFSHSTWNNRQHLFFQVQVGQHKGWSEVLANKNDPGFDFVKWAEYLKALKGMPVMKAIDYCREQVLTGEWDHRKAEPALMALYDIMGKAVNKPTIEIWGLSGRNPVPAAFCILENEVDQALAQAAIAREQGLTHFVKLKLFGIPDTDQSLVTALRKYFGHETFLMADANRGYKNWKDLDELSLHMHALRKAGLNAIEDPADLSKEQWIELQKKIGDLALIPDYPMRPAFISIDQFDPAMGTYFNIHPDTMGTFREVIALGKKIREDQRGLMIGDSSFIGPACTCWQQLAIGLGASWVEAIEKPQESDIFQQCVQRSTTAINKKGLVEIKVLNPGFGLVMDEEKLRSKADRFAKLV
ncbi:MAG: hypothetical protein GC171_10385 [Terrimonas sp.]|nr:hypothetical protein [Terrimonas sp.]